MSTDETPGNCVMCGHGDHSVARCTNTGVEFTRAEYEALGTCPGCGDSSHYFAFPCHDIPVTLNLLEFRILLMWAENYARQKAEATPSMPSTVRAIAERIRAQLPPQLDGTTLTWSDEVKELRQAFGDVKVYRDGEEVPE